MCHSLNIEFYLCDLIGARVPALQQRGGQVCDKRYCQGRNISFKSKHFVYIYSLVFGMQMQSCPHLQEQRQKLASVGLTDIINQVKIIYICLIIDSSVSVYYI